jgi:Uma2 family endonuclease
MSTATLTRWEPGTWSLTASRLPILRDTLDSLFDENTARFTGISWQDYWDLMDYREGYRPGTRIYFNNGELEIVSTSFRHESWKTVLGMLVLLMAYRFKIAMKGAGSMTVHDRDRQMGFEADGCFYFDNHDKVLGKDDLDFRIDPPPDLAIEIDRSRSSMDKDSIYAAFNVPEIWRYDGEELTVFRLQSDGTYGPAPSRYFPWLNPADLLPFASMARKYTDNAIMQSFDKWLSTLPDQP